MVLAAGALCVAYARADQVPMSECDRSAAASSDGCELGESLDGSIATEHAPASYVVHATTALPQAVAELRLNDGVDATDALRQASTGSPAGTLSVPIFALGDATLERAGLARSTLDGLHAAAVSLSVLVAPVVGSGIGCVADGTYLGGESESNPRPPIVPAPTATSARTSAELAPTLDRSAFRVR
jgi:hypothetical protein